MNCEDERLIGELDRRLAKIHGKAGAHPAIRSENAKEAAMNVRHEEFQAMADVFLGKNYDRGKLGAVERLQVSIGKMQAKLSAQLDEGKLTPEQYVDQFNDELAETFENIERILGTDDFQRLFRVPRDQLGGYIDKETFMREHGEIERQRRGKAEGERSQGNNPVPAKSAPSPTKSLHEN